MTDLKMSKPEFIALMAMLFAMTAFSIDAMLPALPEIGRELSPDNLNAAQLILTSFVLGMGLGTFVTGPLSDSFGRKPVMYFGIALYLVGAVLAWAAGSLELVLAARVVQGLGIAAPRVVALAVIRDLFEGRQMARMVSIVMMIFALFPAVAPLLGSIIIAGFGWRSIFAAFMVFALIAVTWMSTRLPETLPRASRRPFNAAKLWSALKEMLSIPVVRLTLVVQTLCLGVLFGALSSLQPIYDVTFGEADSFPYWFALVAVLSASASILNAVFVVRLGMRFIISVTLASQIILSGIMIALAMAEPSRSIYFGYFIFWQFSLFAMAGLTLGNLNAMAMEPLGHIAGLAASIQGGVSTTLGLVFAIPMGLAFNGTPIPAAVTVLVLSFAALVLMLAFGRREGAYQT